MNPPSNPLISIIIPCFNQGEFLEEALASIEEQNYKNIEIIIINDGSDDIKTKQLFKNLESRNYKNLKIIHQINLGLVTARNAGIKKSKGKLIIPVDADDKLGKGFIKKSLKLLNKKSLGFVVANIKHFGENASIHKISISAYDQLWNNYLPYCGLFKKEAFEKLGFYDPKFAKGYEDWEWWIRMLNAGIKGEICPDIYFHYRVRKNSMLTNANKQRIEIIKQIRLKHFNLYKPENFKLIKQKYSEKQKIKNTWHKIHFYIGQKSPILGNLLSWFYIHFLSDPKFWKFILSGGSAFVCFISGLYLFFTILNIHYLISVVIAHIIASLLNFSISKFFVFQCSQKNISQQYFKFLSISLIGLSYQTSFVFTGFKILELNYYLVNMLGSGSFMFVSFWLNKQLTFKLKP